MPIGTSRRRDAYLDLIERFEADAGVVLRQIAEEIQAIPAYHELGEDAQAEVRGASLWGFETFNACLRERRGLTSDELARFRAIGAERAQRGLLWDDLGRAFDVAYGVCYARILFRAGERAEADVLAAFGEVADALRRLYDAAKRAMQGGHVAASGSAPVPGLRARRAAFVEALLEGTADEEELRAREAKLGLRQRTSHGLVVAVCREQAAIADLWRMVQELEAAVPSAVAGVVRAEPLPHAVVLTLQAADLEPPPRLAPAPGSADGAPIRYVIVTETQREELGSLYRRLRTCLTRLHMLTDGDGRLSIDRLALCEVALAMPLEAAREMVGRTLRGIIARPSDERPELLRIARVIIVTGGNIKAASELLGMHRDTVFDRIEWIASLTGLHLRDPDQYHRLALAVLLLEVHGDAVLGLDDPPGP